MRVTSEYYFRIYLDYRFYKRYIIWISDDVDWVLTNDKRQIIAFKESDALINYAKKQDITLDEDETRHSVYYIQKWILNRSDKPDCVLFLNFWNLCTDVSVSVKKEFTGDKKDHITNNIYEKLFNASDTFISNDTNPTFTVEEIEILADILGDGIRLLKENMIVLV